jgi:signal transduction histidine kinase
MVGPPDTKGRVLYIDDDPILSRLVEKTLVREGFTIELAGNGPEGVARAARGGFSAIALDHYMPGQDGLATLLALKTLPDCPPIVYVTGSEDLRIAIAALKAGASDYVIKDVAGAFLTLLTTAIEGALRQASLRREFSVAQEELKQLNATLEQRVAERTAELEETNRKLRQEMDERTRIEAQLVQAQKMEAVGQLTGGTAHDFNNLLTSVLGSLELALLRITDDSVRKLILNAMRSADRGARLTAQLLAFSRQQDLRVRSLDLNQLIAEAEDLLARAIDPRIRIVRVCEPQIWPAIGDPTQLELALLNLTINARDAMPVGGLLRIETRNVPPDAPGRPADLAELGECVALAVSDNGTGMSEDVRARVFEPFFTTKDVGRGSGLGLSMVYGVAKQLGGTVTVDSAPGLGTCVTIYLPRATESQVAAMPRRTDSGPAGPSATDSGAGRGRRVLLVDDDVDVREVTAETLRGLGYDVVETDGARAALAEIDRGVAIDLLMTDLAMPQMRGSDLALEARQRRPGLPVLVITGYGESVDAGAGMMILRKPFRGAQLAAKIAECLGPQAAPNVLPLRRPSS